MHAVRHGLKLVCVAVPVPCFLAGLAFAEQIIKEGSASVTTIKRDGEHCETGATDKREIGKPCFTNLEITGEPAGQLYSMLKQRGVKIMECCGE